MSIPARAAAKLVDRDRALEDGELDALVEHVRGSPEAGRRLRAQLVIDELLGRLLAPERQNFTRRVLQGLEEPAAATRFVERTFAAARRRRRPARRFAAWGLALPAAAAAVVVAGAGLGLWKPAPERPPAPGPHASAPARPAPPALAPPAPELPAAPPADTAHLARVDGARGAVHLVAGGERREGKAGDPLAAGDSLVTGADAAATLAFADGTRLELGADGVLVQPGAGAREPPAKTLLLARGRITAQVARQPAGAPMRFVSPHAEAVVVGTRLALSVADASTRLDVLEGLVRFARHGGRAPAEVRAGHYAIADAAPEPRLGARGSAGRALLVVGPDDAFLGPNDSGVNAPDRALRARLEKLGFDVRVAGAETLTPADARQGDLVVISSTVSAVDAAVGLRDLAVPMLVCESHLFDELGMTGPREDGALGDTPGPGDMDIKDPSHPIAAGLTGTVRVNNRRTYFSWGVPTPQASWIATRAGAPDQASVFAYEKGAQMKGLSAPARRVGFFLRHNAPTALTEQGWALFDAAVRWSAGGR